MTKAIEDFLAHINRRIGVLEAELERLQQVRTGIIEGRGPSSTSESESQSRTKDRKVA